MFVTYCIAHFRPGYPEIPAQHNLRSPMRATGAVLPADPALLIHPSVAPREEPVIAKHRTSAFSGSAFDTILRAQGIETIILMGHATSGVLSTVRLAADLDYHVIVVEDGCADRDPDVHPPDGEGVPAASHGGQCRRDGGGAGSVTGATCAPRGVTICGTDIG